MGSDTMRAVHSDLHQTYNTLTHNSDLLTNCINTYTDAAVAIQNEGEYAGKSCAALLNSVRTMITILEKIRDRVANAGISANNFSVRTNTVDEEGASSYKKVNIN